MGTTFRSHRRSVPTARDLLLTSRSLDAEGMLAAGVATGRCADEVLAEVAAIAGNAPLAMRPTKRALSRHRRPGLAEALRWEGVVQPVTMTTADVQEGLRAARERRDPVFEGR